MTYLQQKDLEDLQAEIQKQYIDVSHLMNEEGGFGEEEYLLELTKFNIQFDFDGKEIGTYTPGTYFDPPEYNQIDFWCDVYNVFVCDEDGARNITDPQRFLIEEELKKIIGS